jgi:hypothetical protein
MNSKSSEVWWNVIFNNIREFVDQLENYSFYCSTSSGTIELFPLNLRGRRPQIVNHLCNGTRLGEARCSCDGRNTGLWMENRSICVLNSDRSSDDANTNPASQLSSCEYLQLNVSPFRQARHTAAAAVSSAMVLPLIISWWPADAESLRSHVPSAYLRIRGHQVSN